MYSFNKHSLNASRSGGNNVERTTLSLLSLHWHTTSTVSPWGPDIWASLTKEQQSQSHLWFQILSLNVPLDGLYLFCCSKNIWNALSSVFKCIVDYRHSIVQQISGTYLALLKLYDLWTATPHFSLPPAPDTHHYSLYFFDLTVLETSHKRNRGVYVLVCARSLLCLTPCDSVDDSLL